MITNAPETMVVVIKLVPIQMEVINAPAFKDMSWMMMDKAAQVH